MKQTPIEVQVQFKFDNQKNFWKEQEAKELARISALQNKPPYPRSDESPLSPRSSEYALSREKSGGINRLYSPRSSEYALSREKSGGINRLGVVHHNVNQFSASPNSTTHSNSSHPNVNSNQSITNSQIVENDLKVELSIETEVINILKPFKRQSVGKSNTIGSHTGKSHSNSNPIILINSDAPRKTPEENQIETNKQILHMEATWLEFMNEVKKQAKSNACNEDIKEIECQEIMSKTQEIEKFKAKIQELTANLLEEEKSIQKYTRENKELQVKILDYQLMALKK